MIIFWLIAVLMSRLRNFITFMGEATMSFKKQYLKTKPVCKVTFKLTKEEASQISNILRVEWIDDFEKILQQVAFEADGFYLGHNEHVKRSTNEIETRQDRLINWCKLKYPLHEYHRAAKITRGLRQIKAEEEIEMIQKAAEISIQGFERVLRSVRPGMMEYELEAELSYIFLKQGAIRHAFKPIVASGGIK